MILKKFIFIFKIKIKKTPESYEHIVVFVKIGVDGK